MKFFRIKFLGGSTLERMTAWSIALVETSLRATFGGMFMDSRHEKSARRKWFLPAHLARRQNAFTANSSRCTWQAKSQQLRDCHT
jgi:hypothetical protein